MYKLSGQTICLCNRVIKSKRYLLHDAHDAKRGCYVYSETPISIYKFRLCLPRYSSLLHLAMTN